MQSYKVRDTQIASYLIALGFENYSLEKEGNRACFIFKLLDENSPLNVFETRINDYYANNVKIEPKKLFNAYREVKSRIAVLFNKSKYA